jgi:hypothetical protein
MGNREEEIMGTQTMVQAIAESVHAWRNCTDAGNFIWEGRWESYLQDLERALPSGAGIDQGTVIDREESDRDRVTLRVAYHNMNEGGFYDGWDRYLITVTPSFSGFYLDMEREADSEYDVSDYLYDTYHLALEAAAPAPEWAPQPAPEPPPIVTWCLACCRELVDPPGTPRWYEDELDSVLCGVCFLYRPWHPPILRSGPDLEEEEEENQDA